MKAREWMRGGEWVAEEGEASDRVEIGREGLLERCDHTRAVNAVTATPNQPSAHAHGAHTHCSVRREWIATSRLHTSSAAAAAA